MDKHYRPVVKANRRRRRCMGAGKVEELAPFRGKFHSPSLGLLATRPLYPFEVAARLLGIFTKGKEVKVVCESYCYKSGMFLELCI